MVNAQKIKELREGANMTISEFAEKICVSQAFASYMELGAKQPSVETLSRIAAFFGVTVDDLLAKS